MSGPQHIVEELNQARRAMNRRARLWLVVCLGLGLAFWVMVFWLADRALDVAHDLVTPPVSAAPAPANEPITMPATTEGAWPICEGPNRAARRVTCVVDGDTFWLFGERHRLACIDTPELDAIDPAQRFHALRAQAHLARMLADPGARLVPTGRRDFFERHLSSIDIVGLRGEARTLEADMVAFGMAVWTDYRATRAHCRARRRGSEAAP
jgi:endonuclease YncB( thermonuclease family)